MQKDEPALEPTDPTLLEMKYVQIKKKKVPTKTPMLVRSIEIAEKNPKQIQQWIHNVNELHKSRPPPTVQYTKNMPDIETLLQVKYRI